MKSQNIYNELNLACIALKNIRKEAKIDDIKLEAYKAELQLKQNSMYNYKFYTTKELIKLINIYKYLLKAATNTSFELEIILLFISIISTL